jgi:hypothetical protein
VHLHDLLGDGEAGPALGLGIGTIHLVELIKDPGLMFRKRAFRRRLMRKPLSGQSKFWPQSTVSSALSSR